ncbi:MAG: hypothetical protein IPH78_12185 [Bacteroidetes bacterium]|nr:hypothetical protein [Bacteroidota bacterium]
MTDDFYYDRIAIDDPIVNRFKRVTTSLLLFLITFIIAHLVHQLILYGIANILMYDTIFMFNKVIVAPHDVRYWGTLRVIAIYITPMFLCLLISLLILRTLFNLEDSVRLYRLVLMWLHLAFFLCFVVQLMAVPFGQVSFSSDFNQGVSVLFRWWMVPDFVGYILALVAVAMAVMWGVFVGNEVLRFSYSSRLINVKIGKRYIARLLLFWPMILAIPVVFFLFYPKVNLFHLLYIGSILCMTIGALLRYNVDMTSVACNKSDLANRWSWDYLLVFLVLLF